MLWCDIWKNDLSCFITGNCRFLDLKFFIFFFAFSTIGYLIYIYYEKFSKKESYKLYVFFHSWLFWTTLLLCITGLIWVPKYANYQEQYKIVSCGMTRGISSDVSTKPFMNECDILHYCSVRNDVVRHAFMLGIFLSLCSGIFPFVSHYIKKEELKKTIYYFNCHSLFCFNMFCAVMFYYLSPIIF